MTSKRRHVTVLGWLAATGLTALVAVSCTPSPKSTVLAAREDAMQALGARIAEVRPGCKVLVLGNPFTKDAGLLSHSRGYDRGVIRGLRKGLGKRSPVQIVFPEIRPEYLANPQSIPVPPDSRTPVSFVIQPSSVDQLADAHPDCDVIVSLIGLPPGVDQLKIWNTESRSFALFLPDLRLVGSPTEAMKAFQRGKILAAVVQDESGAPLVVTRDNFETILQRQPKALGY